MLKLALCVAYGALTRTESRGAHFREDFRAATTREWLKRTLATWKDEADTLPTLAYEPLDVDAMELPPGWRGYGAKDYIDHPDTPRAQPPRSTRLTRSFHGADRFDGAALADAVRTTAAQALRGRNERIDEPLQPPPAEHRSAGTHD